MASLPIPPSPTPSELASPIPAPQPGWFDSWQDAKAYIDAHGMEHSYAVTSNHGDDKKNGKLKLACDRAAKYDNLSGISENEKLKKKSSRKCGCRMHILARKHPNDRWELMIKHERHNHEPSHDMTSHPTLRRLNADALDQIAAMMMNRVPLPAQTAVI